MIDDHFMTHNRIDYANVRGAAALAGVTEGTVRAWIASGRLTALRPKGKKVWLRVDEVHAAKAAAESAPGGRAAALSDHELGIALDPNLTAREASILTGRTIGAIYRARSYHGGAA